MAEKRKLPPRGTPASKKRKSDAAPQLQHQTTPARGKTSTPAQASKPSEPIDDPLPTKIKDADELSTLGKPQVGNLALRDYQNFVESAVVAAALHRSQTKWLQDCLFEKYWTKPSRKKGQPQPANPPKESMTKLGPCTIVIEPHHFDVMLYTVRSPQPQQPVSYSPPSAQKPLIHVQYTAPNSPNTFHQYQPRPPLSQARQPPTNLSSPLPPSQTAQTPQIPQPSSSSPLPPPPTHPTHIPQQGQRQTHQLNPPNPSSEPPSRPPSQPLTIHDEPPKPAPSQKAPDPAPQPPKGSADPVIQMLATRAAVDPELKALMRVVASSEASQEQLRTFQAHIDELNSIIASRNIKQESRPNSPYPSQSAPISPMISTPTGHAPGPPQPVRSAPKSLTFQPQPRPAPNQYPNASHVQAPRSLTGTPPIRSKFSQQPPHTPYLHQQRPPPPIQPAKQDIKAVIFEFITPPGPGVAVSGDRYLLPENMIIDYIPPGTQVIASFLVVKKVDSSGKLLEAASSTAGKPKAKKSKASASAATNVVSQEQQSKETQTPDKSATASAETGENTSEKPKDREFYQPVTMRLFANNPRILEPLARVIKPLPEVQKYMNDVMDRVERAPIRYLAMRLPREKTGKTLTEDNDTNEMRGTPKVGTAGNNNRRQSKAGNGAVTEEESEFERGGAGSILDEDEEELQDFYDAPCGLVPLM